MPSRFRCIAVHFVSYGYEMSRCRAIVCSQLMPICEQAPIGPITPDGTARRNAQKKNRTKRCTDPDRVFLTLFAIQMRFARFLKIHV